MGTTPELPELPRRLGLIGDVHGRLDVLARQVQTLVDAGAELVLQLGDFGGLWDGSSAERRRLERLDETVRLWRTRLLVVPGNHENWDLLDTIEVGAGGIQWVTEALGFLPRGWRGHHGGRIVAALGGANSVDFDRRRAGIEWWPGEAITEVELEQLAAGGHADVLFGHDAPLSKGLDAAVAERGPSGFSAVGLEYARRGQAMFHRGFTSVTPELVVSGHWHVALDTVEDFAGPGGETFRSRSVILDIEGGPGSMALLDLETLGLRVVKGEPRPPRVLAREFRELRRAAGLTTEETAMLLQVGESTVAAIESGHVTIGAHVLDRLRGAL